MYKQDKKTKEWYQYEWRCEDTGEIDCKIEAFNGVCQFKDYAPYISFNVVECSQNNA